MTNNLKRNTNGVGLASKDSEAYVDNKSKRQFQKDVLSRLECIESGQKEQEKSLKTIINLVYNISVNFNKEVNDDYATS